MYQWIIILFSVILGLIGGFFWKKGDTLLILFSKHNQKNIHTFAIILILLSLMGVLIGIFFATQMMALIFVFVVLIVSAVFGFLIAGNMKV